MITSSSNPKIKQIRSLQSSSRKRREAGLFVIEGVRLTEEALHAGWEINLVLYTDGLSDRGMHLVKQFTQSGTQVVQVSAHVMQAASDTHTPQGILATVSLQESPIPDPPDFSLVLDGLRDPGNLGTILRTASAAGVQAVFLTEGSVDPFSPKVLRSAMGAHFNLPIFTSSWEKLTNLVSSSGSAVFLADSSGGLVYTEADFTRPLMLILGSEAEGAGDRARSIKSQRVHIPMPGGGESLNVAVSGGVLMFEVIRQRKQIT